MKCLSTWEGEGRKEEKSLLASVSRFSNFKIRMDKGFLGLFGGFGYLFLFCLLFLFGWLVLDFCLVFYYLVGVFFSKKTMLNFSRQDANKSSLSVSLQSN